MEDTGLDRRREELSDIKRALLDKLRKGRQEQNVRARIPARDPARPVPPSTMQEGLWFLQQAAPKCCAYNIALAYRVRGPLDGPVLQRALDDLVARHEVLRTGFDLVDDNLLAVVQQPRGLPIEQVDLRGREAELSAALEARASKPFDLRAAPLLRVTLFALGEDDHALEVVLHHTIFDGEALAQFEDELAACYAARAAGREPALPDLTLQYGDFAVWQRDAGDPERELAYWRDRLGGTVTVLDLPSDCRRPESFDYRGRTLTVSLSADLSAGIDALAQATGATRFMVLLAAYQALLHRFSGQTDILVGSALGAGARELDSVLGLFANTVVLRGDLREGLTFRQFLEQVRQTTLDALDRRSAPFESVVQSLNPPRDPARTPVFQAMFFQEERRTELALGAATATRVDVFPRGAATDVTLFARGADLHLQYYEGAFSPECAAGFGSGLLHLLEAVVADPDARVSDLRILPAGERSRILELGAAPAAPAPDAATIHGMIAAQTERTPDAIALVLPDTSLTYRDLDRRANRIANALTQLGVAPGDLVGLCLRRGPDLVPALLGVLKAGAGYVPMDPDFPQRRLAHMLEDSRASALVTESGLREALGSTPARLLLVDDPALDAVPDVAPAVRVDGDATAYVIYTSGSTGTPKGVVIPHRAAVNFLHAMARRPGLGPDDVLVAVTTVSFDIAVLELYLPLVTGARAVLVDRATASDGTALLDVLRRSGATVMQATPATWHMLIEAGWRSGPALRVLCGGEQLPRGLAERILRRTTELWNMYGPTETTVWSSSARVVDPRDIRIGTPIDNTRLYVLDAQREPVPFGVVGELYIGGDGLATGYHERPELTAERFVDCPFVPGTRMYRTGDLARMLRDGSFECLGRADSQVKLRGFRIELGEIEAVLSGCDGVEQAAVALIESGRGPELVAFVVSRSGTVDAAALRTRLTAALPTYMIPGTFVALDALPLTPNGKVDRRALPCPDTAPAPEAAPELRRHTEPADWFYTPAWKPVPCPEAAGTQALRFLIFADDAGLGEAVAQRLERRRHVVSLVRSGDGYVRHAAGEYYINAELGRRQYDALLAGLMADDRVPNRILHAWSVTTGETCRPGSSFFHRTQEHGLFSLMDLARALATAGVSQPVHLTAVTNGMQSVAGEPVPHPEKATLLGPCRVIPREWPHLGARSLDVELPAADDPDGLSALADLVTREVLGEPADEVVALRGSRRFVQALAATPLPATERTALRDDGVYLVLGAAGAAPWSLARAIATRHRARVHVLGAGDAPPDTAGVEHVRADIANPSEVRAVVSRIRAERGGIDGIITMPEPAGAVPIDSDEGGLDPRAEARIQSLRVIDELVRSEAPDFVAIGATAEPWCARAGRAATVAADAYAMAIAAAHATATRWIGLAWGPAAGDAGTFDGATRADRLLRAAAAVGFDGDEGYEVLTRALAAARPSTIASPVDLEDLSRRVAEAADVDAATGAGHVRPRTAVERQIAALWSEVLQVGDVSVHDDFFALGGHSLLAVRLFNRIRARFGVDWPLSVLIEAPTVAAIADRIEAGQGADERPGFVHLVELHRGDPSRAPLFVVAGAFGNVLNLRHLAHLCGADRPVYGVQAAGLSGDQPPHETVEEAARAYIEELRRVQPDGPYLLGGYCSGGVLALEMAQQLQREGADIDLLVFLDTNLPQPNDRLSLRDKVRMHLGRLEQRGPRYLLDWMRKHFAWRLGRVRSRLGGSEHREDPARFRSEVIFDATEAAMARYRLQPFDGKVVLFRPPLAPADVLGPGRMINDIRLFLYPDNGWTPWIRDLRVFEVACPPGDHDGFVLEPYVRDLTASLRRCIAEATST